MKRGSGGWQAERPVWLRYVLLQIPGLLLVIVALVLLRLWLGLPVWVGAAALVAWVFKDVLLYPLVRDAYRPEPVEAVRRLVGARGIAEERLDPTGYVRLRGELWQARLVEREGPVEAGRRVRVRDVEGLTVLVEAEAERGTKP